MTWALTDAGDSRRGSDGVALCMKADLSPVPMFRGVELDDLRDLLEYMQSVQFDGESLFFEQGDVAGWRADCGQWSAPGQGRFRRDRRNIGTKYTPESCVGKPDSFSAMASEMLGWWLPQPARVCDWLQKPCNPPWGIRQWRPWSVIWWHRSPVRFVARMWGFSKYGKNRPPVKKWRNR